MCAFNLVRNTVIAFARNRPDHFGRQLIILGAREPPSCLILDQSRQAKHALKMSLVRGRLTLKIELGRCWWRRLSEVDSFRRRTSEVDSLDGSSDCTSTVSEVPSEETPKVTSPLPSPFTSAPLFFDLSRLTLPKRRVSITR